LLQAHRGLYLPRRNWNAIGVAVIHVASRKVGAPRRRNPFAAGNRNRGERPFQDGSRAPDEERVIVLDANVIEIGAANPLAAGP